MKNYICSMKRFWKYHFIIRFPDIEVWCEKYSGSFDTGHRLSLNVKFYSEDYVKNLVKENCLE